MVSTTSDPMETAFTVSVDLRGKGVSTGISAIDRAKTIKALVERKINVIDFLNPCFRPFLRFWKVFDFKIGFYVKNWSYSRLQRSGNLQFGQKITKFLSKKK